MVEKKIYKWLEVRITNQNLRFYKGMFVRKFVYSVIIVVSKNKINTLSYSARLIHIRYLVIFSSKGIHVQSIAKYVGAWSHDMKTGASIIISNNQNIRTKYFRGNTTQNCKKCRKPFQKSPAYRSIYLHTNHFNE